MVDLAIYPYILYVNMKGTQLFVAPVPLLAVMLPFEVGPQTDVAILATP